MSTIRQSNEATHTPGEWFVDSPQPEDDSYEHEIIVKGKYAISIAFVSKKTDAHLISASPDLLAACEEFVRKVDAGEAQSTRSYAQMKAAINKAKGQP